MRLHDAWYIRLEAEREAKIKVLESEIARLRLAVRRLAEQDATLSVQGGSVIVELDATPEIMDQFSQRGGQIVPFDPPQPTLTDAEREAVEWASAVDWGRNPHAATLRGLLARCATGSE